MKQAKDHESMVQELEKVKLELSRLKLDVASASEAKADAEKEATASALRAVCVLHSVEELRKQIDESDEEHALVELARIEAEREHREIEARRVAEAAEFSNRVDAARKTFDDLNQETIHHEELQMKLNITQSSISLLQAELESVRAKDKNKKKKKKEEQERSWRSSSLDAAKAELLAAKEELDLVKEEGFKFMNSMDLIRKELDRIAQETRQLEKLEKKAESSVLRLDSNLLKAKTKLEATTAAEERATTMASKLSTTLNQLQAETEAAQKETQLIGQEAIGVRSQIANTDSEISSAEEKLQAVVQELRAAKASEATAFEKLKSVTKQTTTRVRASLTQCSASIPISETEHDYLVSNAAAAQVVSSKKVAAAQAWMEALTDRERNARVKAELIEKELRELKAVEVRELHETQRSVFARRSLEEDLNRLMKQIEKEDEQLSEEKPRKAVLPRSRSIKIRRIPSSPGAPRQVRSPLIVIKKRTKVMPNLLIAILLPFAIIIGIYFKRRNVYDLHNAILAGLLFSVLITGVITDAIKDAVGRPRPDFFWRCFPDGNDIYNNVTTEVICHGEKGIIKEGHKSFPSGHSSWSFAGLGFLAWYLAGKIQAFDRRGHVAKLCIVFLPLLCASLVAISRVDDYWHHWQDVFAGGFLGLVVSSFCYLQFFPPPYHLDGWLPHASLHTMADTRNEVQLQSTTNSLQSRPSVIDTVYVASEGQNGIHMRDTSAIMDSMEAGWRH
ncbi:unnamed protein product [Musa banksii]